MKFKENQPFTKWKFLAPNANKISYEFFYVMRSGIPVSGDPCYPRVCWALIITVSWVWPLSYQSVLTMVKTSTFSKNFVGSGANSMHTHVVWKSLFCPDPSCPFLSGPVLSCPIMNGPMLSYPVWHVMTLPVRTCRVLFYLDFPCPVLSCSIQS